MNLLTKKKHLLKNKASRRDHWISMIEPYYYDSPFEREKQDNNSKKKHSTNIFWQKITKN